jgi:hypothetical protein
MGRSRRFWHVCAMSGQGHSRPGRASSEPGHVRSTAESGSGAAVETTFTLTLQSEYPTATQQE